MEDAYEGMTLKDPVGVELEFSTLLVAMIQFKLVVSEYLYTQKLQRKFTSQRDRFPRIWLRS